MSTIGFARFNKQFASGGIVTALSDAQAAAGWAFLGTSPPTVEEFNAMMQSFDDKDNYLFGNLSTLATNAGVSAPADGDFTTLYKAVVALLVSGVAPVLLTGTSAAYVLANTLPVGAYANGQKFRAIVNVTSAANATLKVDTLAAIPIYGRGASAIQAGEMPVNAIATFEILISATVNGGSPVAILGQAAGGPLQVATATQSNHAVTLAQLQASQGNFNAPLALNVNTTLTAAQMSGGAIEWFGASGGILTLPSAATLSAGKFTKIYNYGAGTLLINTSGVAGDFIYNGLITTITSLTLQRGDEVELLARGSQEIDMVGGSTLRQFYPLIVGSATVSTHAMQAQQVQNQAVTAYTAGGAAPVYTLTVTPAPAALAANQRWRVKFAAAGTTGSNTLNLNGSGAKNLMQFANDGTLTPAIISANLLADVEYDGTEYVVLDPVGQNGFTNMAVYINNGGTQQVSINGGAFTNTGASTFPPPLSGRAKYRVWGAGGGSGATWAAASASKGGGGGAYAEGIVVGLTTAVAVSVGVGGTAGVMSSSPTNGGTGGTSSFGSIASCTAGTGGVAANGGIAGGGGLGGTASSTNSGGLLYAGVAAWPSYLTASSGGVSVASAGGASFGSPGQGVGASNVSANGSSGTFPGGGATGCINQASGAVGANGCIILEW